MEEAKTPAIAGTAGLFGEEQKYNAKYFLYELKFPSDIFRFFICDLKYNMRVTMQLICLLYQFPPKVGSLLST